MGRVSDYLPSGEPLPVSGALSALAKAMQSKDSGTGFGAVAARAMVSARSSAIKARAARKAGIRA